MDRGIFLQYSDAANRIPRGRYYGWHRPYVLLGGCFMGALALITLTIPIISPLVPSLGFNPIWFGVIIVLVTEMGVINPVGVNVYVIKGIAEEVPLETIFTGIFPLIEI